MKEQDDWPVSIDLQKKIGYYSKDEASVLSWVRKHKSLSEECHKTLARLDNSIIYYYALLENYQAVQDLMAAGVDVDINHKSISALASMVRNNNLLGVKKLLELGANPNLANKNNWTPLFFIDQSTSLEICRLLIEHGADFSRQNGRSQSAIMRICHQFTEQAPNLKILEMLPSFDLDQMDSNGNTALGLTIHSGKAEVVRRLIQMGASIEVVEKRSFFINDLKFNALKTAKKVLKTGVNYPPNGYTKKDLKEIHDYIETHINALTEKKKLEKNLDDVIKSAGLVETDKTIKIKGKI